MSSFIIKASEGRSKCSELTAYNTPSLCMPPYAVNYFKAHTKNLRKFAGPTLSIAHCNCLCTFKCSALTGFQGPATSGITSKLITVQYDGIFLESALVRKKTC